MQLGLRNVDVIPRTSDVYADIQNVRSILSRCKFDMEHCKDGVMALKQYRREYDENRKCFKNTPLHDWTSHGADAFRGIPYIERKIKGVTVKRSKEWNGRF